MGVPCAPGAGWGLAQLLLFPDLGRFDFCPVKSFARTCTAFFSLSSSPLWLSDSTRQPPLHHPTKPSKIPCAGSSVGGASKSLRTTPSFPRGNLRVHQLLEGARPGMRGRLEGREERFLQPHPHLHCCAPLCKPEARSHASSPLLSLFLLPFS